MAPLEKLAAGLLILHGLLSLGMGLHLRALHAQRRDPVTGGLALVCLAGTVPAAALLLALHLAGGPMVAMQGGGRAVIGGAYLALGAGVVTTLLFLRGAYYAGGRALVALAVAAGGFFLLEALVVPSFGYSIPAIGLSLAHFPLEIAVYGWAAYSAFTTARHERMRPGGDPEDARRHRLLGFAFVMPALWVATSFALIRHPQLMGLGGAFGVASMLLVWRAYPLHRAERAAVALRAR